MERYGESIPQGPHVLVHEPHLPGLQRRVPDQDGPIPSGRLSCAESTRHRPCPAGLHGVLRGVRKPPPKRSRHPSEKRRTKGIRQKNTGTPETTAAGKTLRNPDL